jgi:hypothetical protein
MRLRHAHLREAIAAPHDKNAGAVFDARSDAGYERF